MQSNAPQSTHQEQLSIVQLKIDLTIVAESGLSIGGSGSTGVRADKTMLRDGQNRPIIPASQMKGRLRHACESILRKLNVPICRGPYPDMTCPHYADVVDPPCPICQLFGAPWYASRLTFADLIDQSMVPAESAIRPGIGVDRRRGVVREDLLFLTETTAPGSAPTFISTGPSIAGDVVHRGAGYLLLAGLSMIQSLGGNKSQGMGWTTINADATFIDQQGESAPCKLDDGKEVLAAWLQTYTP